MGVVPDVENHQWGGWHLVESPATIHPGPFLNSRSPILFIHIPKVNFATAPPPFSAPPDEVAVLRQSIHTKLQGIVHERRLERLWPAFIRTQDYGTAGKWEISYFSLRSSALLPPLGMLAWPMAFVTAFLVDSPTYT